MKPWQTLMNKAPSKGEEKERTKVGHKGAQEQNPVREPPPVARSTSERDLMKNMSGSQGADKANPKLGVKLTRGSIQGEETKFRPLFFHLYCFHPDFISSLVSAKLGPSTPYFRVPYRQWTCLPTTSITWALHFLAGHYQ